MYSLDVPVHVQDQRKHTLDWVEVRERIAEQRWHLQPVQKGQFLEGLAQ